MPYSPFGMFTALASALTLPLAGPVHADAAATVETVAPLAASASVVAAATPSETLLVSRPVVQALPAPRPEMGEDEQQFEPFDSGLASFYGNQFAGRRTASGAIFDPEGLTAAHRTLPFGTQVQVTNPSNGESVIVTITDRGPFHSNRVIDLSKAAAREIGIVGRGSGTVKLAVLSNEH
ncbi:septal ring lytic transglycosylase RlpA family protein [Novosphingobium sp. 1949]|uniref:Endolytic peptidoglycan transglycosylase RlpA n=1 Tax=Novosphingobium organovorum TaxID=2930092 RepID=A0ABT0BHQ0_9SPHN|nr:septal ring lytic transglycosylase RlpA family protein [Novosphingobium organovorum]MCJ2184565.1 septal ring lytic transglycosylase RlpA family protein [Novosphingobium organovorum]